MPDFTAHLSQAPWGQGQGSSIFLFISAAYKCEALADVMESSLNIQSYTLSSKLLLIMNLKPTADLG